MKSNSKRKHNLRIKSKNKSYPLQDSPFYKLSSKKKLEKILGVSIPSMAALCCEDSYRVFNIEKNNKSREIQAPKFDLDIVHTRIASLLVRLKVPDYLHSGIKGRSNITNAASHIGTHPVLTMDIKNFYPSISKKSIYNFFHSTMCMPTDLAGILANICTIDEHLPTGSRISMPLSFWANHVMYTRLHNYCKRRSTNMSVFVDDLTFSGAKVNRLFNKHAQLIIEESGLVVHPKKTRLYSRDQPKLITGVIVHNMEIKVRNKHHKAIYSLFSEIPECNNDTQLEILQKQLIGRLSAAGQINPVYKLKARNVLLGN